MLARDRRWDYPAIAGVEADLLLVTHEHLDHNGIEAVGGDPVTLRSTAGRLNSPIGEVLGIASEHDEVAGTARGANTLARRRVRRARGPRRASVLARVRPRVTARGRHPTGRRARGALTASYVSLGGAALRAFSSPPVRDFLFGRVFLVTMN